jgi:hypothetical protein
VVAGRNYSVWDSPLPPNPDIDHLAAGDTIRIVYDRLHPEVSCACEPLDWAGYDQWWQNPIGGLFLASIGSVGLTMMIVRRRT